MTRQRHFWLCIFLVLGLAAAACNAQDAQKTGSEAGAFLRMGLGARSLGMGGHAAALIGDGFSMYGNPAGLVFIPGRWGGASLRNMSLDRRLTFLGYAQRIGPEKPGKGALRGGFGLGWISAGVTDIDGRDFSGSHTEMLWAGEHAFQFSFALQPDSHVAIGMTAKLVYHRLGGVQNDGSALTAMGFGFDLGILIRPSKVVTVGAVIKDLRTRYTWDTQELFDMGTQTADYFPLRAELAASWLVENLGLLVSGGVEKIEFRSYRFHMGAEWQLIDPLWVRAGLRAGQPTFGLGFEVLTRGARMTLNYALVANSVLPAPDHVISWAVLF